MDEQQINQAGVISQWPKLLNSHAGPHAAIDRTGDSYFLVTCQGMIHCDKEDLPFIRDQLKAAVILLSGIIDA
jgi:hypothetical protein